MNQFVPPSDFPAPLQPSTEALPGTKEFGARQHPWRRYFAKWIDLMLMGGFAMMVVAIAVAMFASADVVAQMEEWLDVAAIAAIAVVLFWLPLEALAMGTIGTTPGRWLYGIDVRDVSGRTLTMAQSFKRATLLSVLGLGLGIPIAMLVLSVIGHKRLLATGTTVWDTKSQCVVTHAQWSGLRRAACITITLALIVSIVILNVMAKE